MRPTNRSLFLIIALMTLFQELCTASGNENFHKYGFSDGLPGENIYGTIQDRDGFLWIAGNAGVVRFDGFEFRRFTTRDGLPGNHILRIYQDRKGRVWFFPLDHKPCYFLDGTIYSEHNSSVLAGFPKEIRYCTKVKETAEGYLWFVCPGYGLIEYGPDGRVRPFPNNENSKYYDLWLREPGEVWTFQLNTRHWQFILEEVTSGNRITGPIPGKRFSGREYLCALDEHRLLWASGNAIYKLDVEDQAHPKLEKQWEGDGLVLFLRELREGEIWAGTNRGAIRFRQDDNALTVVGEYLPTFSVTGINVDDEGNYWFSTFINGLYFTSDIELRSVLGWKELHGSLIISTGMDADGILYVGTSDNRYFRIRESAPPASVALKKCGNRSSRINGFRFSQNEEKMLIFGDCGVWLEGKHNSLAVLKEALQSSNGDTWLSDYRGLYRFEGGDFWENPFFPTTADSSKLILGGRTKCLFEDHRGELWIGTERGLVCWRKGEISFFSEGHPLHDKPVSDIAADEHGRLIVATESDGLVVMDNGRTLIIDENMGLLANKVNCIRPGNNRIWVGTSKGLNLLQYSEKAGILIEDSRVSYAFAGKNIVGIEIKGNRLIVATQKGVFETRIPAGQIRSKPPDIRLKGFKASDRPMDHKSPLSLDPGQNRIEISFAGLSFHSKGYIRYQYKLLGLTDRWEETATGTVVFPALPPGEYTFLVRAKDRWGKVSAQAASLSFTIRKPIWLRPWFLVIGTLSVFMLLFWGIHLRIRRIRRIESEKRQRQNQLNQLKMNAIAAQMNPHFTFNTLNAIQQFIIVNNRESAVQYIAKFAKLIRTTLERSRQNFVPLEKEIETIRLYLELEAMRLEDSFDYTIEVDPVLTEKNPMVPPSLIQPIVENAIWHGLMGFDGKGKVKVCLREEGNSIRFIIEDNGIGREKAAEIARQKMPLKRSTGIRIINEWLELLNGELDSRLIFTDLYDRSGNASGTRVEFKIPIQIEDA